MPTYLIGRTAEDIPSPGSPNEYTPDDWNRRWTHNRSRLKHSEAMSDVQAGMGKPAYAEQLTANQYIESWTLLILGQMQTGGD